MGAGDRDPPLLAARQLVQDAGAAASADALHALRVGDDADAHPADAWPLLAKMGFAGKANANPDPSSRTPRSWPTCSPTCCCSAILTAPVIPALRYFDSHGL